MTPGPGVDKHDDGRPAIAGFDRPRRRCDPDGVTLLRGSPLLALLLAGCFDPTGPLGAACSPAAPCAIGLDCVNGTCSIPGTADAAPGSDAPIDAGAPDAGPLARDCLELHDRGETTDGAYLVDPDGEGGTNPPLTVYCDQTTAGGGWTLVYVYRFTNYDNFNGAGNAVTPQPSWPGRALGGGATPVSTTTPASPTDVGALDFTRWASLGPDFLVTSTITTSYSCRPGAGSLVAADGGTVTCEVVAPVSAACTPTVPTLFDQNSYGPTLRGPSGNYYYWDGSTGNNWPTHDPCGNNSQNHLRDVADPRGAIWLRRAP